MADSPQIEYRTKLAAEALAFEFDFSLTAVDVWQPNAFVAANGLRRPSTEDESADGTDHSTGWIYQASADGQTGPVEPAWPSTGTVSDGSLTWTPQVPGGAAEDTLASATATQVSPPDAQLQVGTPTVGTLTASVTISGGTSGETYLVEATGVRKSGNSRTVQLYVTVL